MKSLTDRVKILSLLRSIYYLLRIWLRFQNNPYLLRYNSPEPMFLTHRENSGSEVSLPF
jgi:hypothetical protein